MKRPHVFIPLEPHADEHYLIQLHAVISDYFKLLEKPNFEAIFYRRHYCSHNKETLIAIGRDYNVTRERIRQIAKIGYSQIVGLLKGRTLKKPHCTVREEIRRHLKDSVENYCKDDIIIKKDLIENAETNLSKDAQHYIYHLDILMESLEYIKEEYKSQEYYIASSSPIKLSDICKKIKEYLNKKDVAISQDDLIRAVKISVSLLETVLRFMPEVELVEYGHYRLASDSLIRYSDLAYRLLKEHGKPMHFKDIDKAIGAADSTNAARYRTDSRLVGIGKTGMWGLEEWDMNNDSIIDVIRDALKHFSKPATYDQIIARVQKIRPDLSKEQTMSCISLYRKQFKWVSEDTIALREWTWVKGRSRIYRHRRPVINRLSFEKIVINAIKKDTLTAHDLTKKIAHNFPNEKIRYIGLRLYRLPVLERIDIKGIAYFKRHPEYKKYIVPRKLKQSSISDAAIEILSKKGSMGLNKLIYLVQEKGFNKASIYSFLRKDNRFSIVRTEGVRVCNISLTKNLL
jgi:DNA-directed RNA polymerase delta subunit